MGWWVRLVPFSGDLRIGTAFSYSNKMSFTCEGLETNQPNPPTHQRDLEWLRRTAEATVWSAATHTTRMQRCSAMSLAQDRRSVFLHPFPLITDAITDRVDQAAESPWSMGAAQGCMAGRVGEAVAMEMQTAILLHLADTHGSWPFKVNKSGRKQWLHVKFCSAVVWFCHAAKRMRDDYRATCEGKPTLDGYRVYLRRECLRDINRDPSLLVWFDDLTADAWTRRRWAPSKSGG